METSGRTRECGMNRGTVVPSQRRNLPSRSLPLTAFTHKLLDVDV